jgi:hypothetical protein
MRTLRPPFGGTIIAASVVRLIISTQGLVCRRTFVNVNSTFLRILH